MCGAVPSTPSPHAAALPARTRSVSRSPVSTASTAQTSCASRWLLPSASQATARAALRTASRRYLARASSRRPASSDFGEHASSHHFALARCTCGPDTSKHGAAQDAEARRLAESTPGALNAIFTKLLEVSAFKGSLPRQLACEGQPQSQRLQFLSSCGVSRYKARSASSRPTTAVQGAVHSPISHRALPSVPHTRGRAKLRFHTPTPPATQVRNSSWENSHAAANALARNPWRLARDAF